MGAMVGGQGEQFTGSRGSHCLMLAWVFPRNVSNPDVDTRMSNLDRRR